jgi:hypothetical protein
MDRHEGKWDVRSSDAADTIFRAYPRTKGVDLVLTVVKTSGGIRVAWRGPVGTDGQSTSGYEVMKSDEAARTLSLPNIQSVDVRLDPPDGAAAAGTYQINVR